MMTKGEIRKRLEIEYSKTLGVKATKEQIRKARELAAILAG